MVLNLSGGVAAYDTMIGNFEKTVTHEVVTITHDNYSGQESLSFANSVEVKGAFFRRGEGWQWEKQGLFENADAILIVKPSVSIKRDDKITYDDATYKVGTVVKRELAGSHFYTSVELFLSDNS